MDLAVDGPRGHTCLPDFSRGVAVLLVSLLSPVMGSSQHVCGTSLHSLALLALHRALCSARLVCFLCGLPPSLSERSCDLH